MLREEVLRAGADRSLVGILSKPTPAASERCGVLLLNAGLVHRVGPARLWVQLARRLCERGHAVLRFDFSGVGDSPQGSQVARFEHSAPLETRAAMDALAESAGARRFALIGLCSGAEIAFKTALADPRVCALVLVNPPRFVEEPSAELVAQLERRQAQRYYWSIALRNPRSWWKALRGRADLGAIGRALLGRLSKSRSSAVLAQRSADLAAIQALCARQVRMHVVLSEGDWAQHHLETILGPGDARARIERTILPACDHLLTPLATQQALLQHVGAWAGDWD